MTSELPPRLRREKATIEAMVAIYCRARHGATGREMCRDCRELLDYAEKRLALCPFQEHKPTCGNCTVHCYKPSLREKVRSIMRFAGPRMLRRHPLMAIRHLLDGRRRPPDPAAARSLSPPAGNNRKRTKT